MQVGVGVGVSSGRMGGGWGATGQINALRQIVLIIKEVKHIDIYG